MLALLRRDGYTALHCLGSGPRSGLVRYLGIWALGIWRFIALFFSFFFSFFFFFFFFFCLSLGPFYVYGLEVITLDSFNLVVVAVTFVAGGRPACQLDDIGFLP